MSGLNVNVAIDGELTVFTASALKDQILEGLTGTQTLTLDLAQVTDADAAGMQLLIATVKEARRRGASVQLRSAPGKLQSIVQFAGLSIDALSRLGQPVGEHP